MTGQVRYLEVTHVAGAHVNAGACFADDDGMNMIRPNGIRTKPIWASTAWAQSVLTFCRASEQHDVDDIRLGAMWVGVSMEPAKLRSMGERLFASTRRR